MDGVGAEASDKFLMADPNPLIDLKTEDLKLAIRLKKLDLQVKQQEHDTRLLRVRQCELEAHRNFTSFEQLRELVLLEGFKNTLLDKIVVHLNEQKVSSCFK